jgi:nicotinate-nucleotide adenylyltransferase
VPKMEISASFIRDAIKMGKDVSSLIPQQAWEYIDEMNFYK